MYTFYLREKTNVPEAVMIFLISVTLKNGYKQLRYYFPIEIKNSTHSNEKILRLKQSTIFIKIYS